MARELVNASVTHVSYVGKAANKKQFFLTKSADKPTFQKEVKVFVNKEEAEQQLVYGIVYSPGSADDESTHDTDGDFMTAAEIEKAAHGFVKDARNIDTQHDFESGVGEVVESYIAPADFTIGEEAIAKGSWILVTKASDEIWEAIQKGAYTGYSLAGTAKTIEKQVEKPLTKSENDEEKGLFNLLKNFFTGKTEVEKGAVADKYNKDRRRREFWAAQDALNSVIMNWDSCYNSTIETDSTKIREALQDFIDIAQEVLVEEDIAKAVGSPPKGDDEEMKAEDITKAVTEALAPITERLEAVEKEIKKEAPEPEAVEKDEVLDQIKGVLKDALAPLTERLDTVEKARGVSKQADDDKEQVPVQKHYLNGFI
ncbi:terminase [Sporosarcina sp. resist]|uniref:XkdF-like putative serine protease domain-containing protein n=1 Tax=Sporosarcina sp. resist TaxID=2762563 RepID=UPI00164D633B|nr:XkdF-like putative serine protease domain-containing protein [Sporosarcina sp. resist]QNK87755.1 terminase [Sporosarcina sp. resist]